MHPKQKRQRVLRFNAGVHYCWTADIGDGAKCLWFRSSSAPLGAYFYHSLNLSKKQKKKNPEILKELRQGAAATALGSMLPAFLGGDSLDAEASAQALIFLPTFPHAHCQHLFHLCGMKVTSTCSPVTLGFDWHQRLDMWQKPSDYGLWYWDSDYHCLPTFGRLRNSNSFLSPLLHFQVYVCPHAQMYVVAWMCRNPRMILRVSLSHSPLTLLKYDP